MARKGWLCDKCGLGFTEEAHAKACEAVHLNLDKMTPFGAEWEKGDPLPHVIYFVVNGNVMLQASYEIKKAPPRHLILGNKVAKSDENISKDDAIKSEDTKVGDESKESGN